MAPASSRSAPSAPTDQPSPVSAKRQFGSTRCKRASAAARRRPPPSQPRPLGRTTAMTSAAKAPAGETPAARQKRVWDKSAPSYDKQIAFFEKIQFGGGREWLGERAHSHVLEVAIGT